MEKNEIHIHNIINKTRNDLIKLKNSKSKINTMSKCNSSRNIFSKNAEQTSMNFSVNKKISKTNNISRDFKVNPNKNEDLKIITNSISKRRTFLINNVEFDTNYLRKILSKKNSKSYELKDNTNIFGGINISPIKGRRKIDFINYQFLLGQKNYFKKLFQHYDFKVPLCKTKRINPYLSQDSKKYVDEGKLKKNPQERDILNLPVMKEKNKKFSLSSYRTMRSNNINSFSKINNQTMIKFEKYNAPGLKRLNDLLLFKINKRKNKGLIKKEKIIDDNYNEYLKGISLSNTNRIKREITKLSKKNHKAKIKSLKNDIFSYDKADIYHNIKRINNNNNNLSPIKTNKNFFKFKKYISNRNKSLEDIIKNNDIENNIIRKK